MRAQDIRSAVNAYSRLTSGHPYENFGNDIKITVNDDCPIRECSVRTQYESREKKEERRPYRGGDIAPRKYFKLSEVDAWSYNLNVPDNFTDRKTFFDVTGSAHVEGCSTCSGKGRNTCGSCMGKGKETCPRCHGDYRHLRCSSCGGDGRTSCKSCGGKGEHVCTKCNGTGSITESVSEWKTHWDYNLQKQVGGYEWVKKSRSCPDCSGRGHWRCNDCRGTGSVRCSSCDGDGYVTCPDCTEGLLVCKTCYGSGTLTCTICEGAGKNEFRYIVNRTLSNERLRRMICDSRVREFAEEGKYSFESVDFKFRADSLLDRELFAEDVRCSSALSKLVAKADTENKKTLFQEARVQSVGSTYVEYEFEGGSYKGIICNGTFVSVGDSPIDEWAADIVGKAEKRMKMGSSATTLKMLNQAEMAGGNIDDIKELRSKARRKLDRIYSAGVSTAFWFYVVLITPVLFNFYYKLNPVLSWAIVVNNPKWNFFGLLPLVQTVIFLVTIVALRMVFIGKAEDAARKEYPSVWLYFAKGFGMFFLYCLAALAILVLLNYLGFSVFTTFIVGAILYVVVLVVALACLVVGGIAKWIIGLFA